LTADEVTREYTLGRTGKSLNVIDTAVCIGGVAPRAQLDVRGSARFDGKLAIGYYGSSDKEALAPLDVRGDYIQSSANGTVSTAARFSSSDGTLHVSSVRTSNGAETLALQTTIDNKTMDYNIENSWSYGTDARHALCLQPYKGRVGVRVTSPSYPLHVAGSAGNMPTMKYFNSGSTSLASGGNDAITIYAAGNIYASGLVAASDERIKKEIVDADDAECLETLRLLNPKKYRYKDEINRGQEPVWGFIAQEVRETLPYATALSRQAIPNIYELANVSSSNVITFSNFDTSDLEANATTIQVQTVADMEESVTIAEIIDEHAIRVEEDLSNWTGSVDETGNVVAGNQLFVYGQKMDDFVLLKKDAIWTVATAALQEVDRQQQADKLRIAELETQLASVLARLDAFTAPDAEFPELKTRLQTIETQANSAIQILSEFGVSGLMDPIDTSTWPAEATLAVLDARLKPIETGATGARAILDLFGVDGLPEFTVDETDAIESRISALESAGRTAQKTLQNFGVDI